MEDPKFTIARIVIDGNTRQITAECALEHPGHSMKQAMITLPHTDALASCREYVFKHVYQTLFQVIRFDSEVIRFDSRIPKAPEGRDREPS